MLKALFFGTSAFAVPSLRAVAACANLAGVVTQPDRPSGRGQKLHPTPVKRAARELGLRIYEPASMRAFADELSQQSFDLFALASYGRILPQSLLDRPRLGSLNVHPSLLPRYRGATPIQSALARGDSETGVSILLMDSGMDTGPVVLQERVAVEPRETYGELHDRLAVVGARLLADAIAMADRNGIAGSPQRGEASVTKPLRKADLELDWTRSAHDLDAFVRSLSPVPAARASIAGHTVKILRAHADGGANAPAGSPVGVRGDALIVASGEGSLAIDEVIAPSRGRESGASFWHRVAPESVS